MAIPAGRRPLESNGNTAVAGLAAIVVLLLGASAWVPHIPLVGVIGLDDLLPVAAVGLGMVLVLRLAPPWPDDPLVPPLSGLLLLGLVSNLLSASTLDWAVLARGPGRTLFYLLLVVVMTSAGRAMSPRRLVEILALAATVEAVIGLALWAADLTGPFGIGIHRPGRGSSLFWTTPGRLVATFNLPSGRGMNGLAAYFALFMPVTLAIAAVRRGAVRVCWLFGAVLQGTSLYLTFTRSTLVALMVGSVGVLWLFRRALILPTIALGGLTLLVSPELVGRFVSDGTDRLALAWAAMGMGAEAPWLGHGDIHYNAYLWAASERMHTPFGVAVTTPHNSLALSFFRYGIVGPFLSAVLLAVPVVVFWRRAECRAGPERFFALAGLCAFVAFALQSLTNNLLEVPKISIFFWVLWVALVAASDEVAETS